STAIDGLSGNARVVVSGMGVFTPLRGGGELVGRCFCAVACQGLNLKSTRSAPCTKCRFRRVQPPLRGDSGLIGENIIADNDAAARRSSPAGAASAPGSAGRSRPRRENISGGKWFAAPSTAPG